MIETLIGLIILFITFYIVIFSITNLILLLFVLILFIIGSLTLIFFGHILVGTTFIIVYSGAILVFLCIATLITPNIKKDIILSNNNIIFNFKNLIIISISLFLLFTLIYFYLENKYSEVKDFLFSEMFFKQEFLNTLFDTHPELLDYYLNFLNKNIDYIFNIIKYQNKSYKYFDLELFRITDYLINEFNYINTPGFSYAINYFEEPLNIIFIGVFLLIILIICLYIFSIIFNSKLIKRQESTDQILKRWI